MSKILIVDDSPVEIKIIRRLLGDKYEILEATSGQAALEITNEAMPDLILLDIIMPEMDGLSICKVLKSQRMTQDIPVIFITSASASRDVVRGFEVGGQDYITKPFNSSELCARIKVHLDLKKSKETLLEYAKELEVKNQQLEGLLEKVKNLAMTDFLTGLVNRRHMTQRIKAEVDDLNINHSSTTLILADLDEFKKVNDNYGHDCGDLVLKDVAGLIKSIVREEDIIARWGGEEFLLMLPGIDLEGGKIVAEKIRQGIETTFSRYQEKALSITMTLGVAELDQNLGIDASIKKADEALYKGKHKSRNCVVTYDAKNLSNLVD